MSPSHLVLFTGGMLVLSSPLRALWHLPSGRSTTFAGLLPALVSTTLVTSLAAFFFMHFSPWLTGAFSPEPYRFIPVAVPQGDLAAWFLEEIQLEGFAAILVTTVILMAPTLLLLRRWALPAGSLTMLFSTVALLWPPWRGSTRAPPWSAPWPPG